MYYYYNKTQKKCLIHSITYNKHLYMKKNIRMRKWMENVDCETRLLIHEYIRLEATLSILYDVFLEVDDCKDKIEISEKIKKRIELISACKYEISKDLIYPVL